jgi:hypothetical protein
MYPRGTFSSWETLQREALCQCHGTESNTRCQIAISKRNRYNFLATLRERNGRRWSLLLALELLVNAPSVVKQPKSVVSLKVLFPKSQHRVVALPQRGYLDKSVFTHREEFDLVGLAGGDSRRS